MLSYLESPTSPLSGRLPYAHVSRNHKVKPQLSWWAWADHPLLHGPGWAGLWFIIYPSICFHGLTVWRQLSQGNFQGLCPISLLLNFIKKFRYELEVWDYSPSPKNAPSGPGAEDNVQTWKPDRSESKTSSAPQLCDRGHVVQLPLEFVFSSMQQGGQKCSLARSFQNVMCPCVEVYLFPSLSTLSLGQIPWAPRGTPPMGVTFPFPSWHCLPEVPLYTLQFWRGLLFLFRRRKNLEPKEKLAPESNRYSGYLVPRGPSELIFSISNSLGAPAPCLRWNPECNRENGSCSHPVELRRQWKTWVWSGGGGEGAWSQAPVNRQVLTLSLEIIPTWSTTALSHPLDTPSPPRWLLHHPSPGGGVCPSPQTCHSSVLFWHPLSSVQHEVSLTEFLKILTQTVTWAREVTCLKWGCI